MHHMTKTSSPSPVKPVRLTISVTPEVHQTFSRMASAGSMSISRAMGDWLGDTLDAAAYVAEKLEEARAAPRLVAQEMHAYALGLADMTSELMQTLRKGSGKGKTGAAVEPTVGGTAAAPVAPAPLPPRTVIRGGKSTKTPKKPGKH